MSRLSELDMTLVCENGYAMIDELLDYAGLDELLNNEYEYTDEWEIEWHDEIPDDMNCCVGASRLVFYNDTFPDIVYKMDIAPWKNTYSEIEACVYERAIEANCAECFAETKFAFEFNYNGEYHPVYIMQRCETDGVSNKSFEFQVSKCLQSTITNRDDAEDYVQSEVFYEGQDSILECAKEEWGEDNYRMVIEILTNKINDELEGRLDLHSGNWGIINNHLILIDYAGYGYGNGCGE